jgi:hypothetical protein
MGGWALDGRPKMDETRYRQKWWTALRFSALTQTRLHLLTHHVWRGDAAIFAAAIIDFLRSPDASKDVNARIESGQGGYPVFRALMSNPRKRF